VDTVYSLGVALGIGSSGIDDEDPWRQKEIDIAPPDPHDFPKIPECEIFKNGSTLRYPCERLKVLC
jgi:hypothetical protein